MTDPATDDMMRCGFVAIVGAPNAGKSTLLNRLSGAKLAIVSSKVQTTRSRTLGIVIQGKSQIVFVDTPGIFKPRRRLDRAMVAAAWEGVDDADQVILIIDAPAATRRIEDELEQLIAKLKDSGRTIILALNKIDGMHREKLLGVVAKLSEMADFSKIFMISALTGDGVPDLLEHVSENLPEGPWHYPEDQLTDITERVLAAEVTREKLYGALHDELPYSATVETETWEEKRDGSVRISQVIFIERESQKAIVIGKGGQQLKKIGQRAREDLEEMFERKVHLFLFVKVRENWGDDRERYRDIGLDFVE